MSSGRVPCLRVCERLFAAAITLAFLALAALVATVGLGATAPPARAAGAGFSAGSAVINIAPRPYSATEDPNDFKASCPELSMDTGPREWADNEPYIDVKKVGHYVGPEVGDPQNGVPSFPGDPYCDANKNGRYDQIYSSGGRTGSPKPAVGQIGDLQARAFALGAGGQIDVIVSVMAQGLFNTYIDEMSSSAKADAAAQGVTIANVIVSANHNEGTPDTVGIYGGPSETVPPLIAPEIGSSPETKTPAGLQSGIDDYYMTYLDRQVGEVAAQAAEQMKPATFSAGQFREPVDTAGSPLAIHLSDNWPTTDNGEFKPTATDPKIGVLQARESDGTPIFTVMSLAAHNQDVGQHNEFLSGDWPGYFQEDLDRTGKMGTGIFLAADIGSQEDPETNPGTVAGAEATGHDFANAIETQVSKLQQLRDGPLTYASTSYCVPLENNLFKAAATIGLFGKRHLYTYEGGTCTDTGTTPPTGPTGAGVPDGLKTSVSRLDVGPDLQLISTPGEIFPALVLGSPWSESDVPAACRDRPNPLPPVWSAHAQFRFSVGLSGDFIGYEIPPWAFISAGGAFTTQYSKTHPEDAECVTGTPEEGFQGGKDKAGHSHKLESEGVGPTGSYTTATNLRELITNDSPDPTTRIVEGRFVMADGTYSDRPAGAVGILLAANSSSGEGANPAVPASTELDPSGGALLGDPALAGLGTRAVDGTAVFMDYDGQPQSEADITTRGMMTFDSLGCVSARYYLDVYPSLSPATPAPLGRAVMRTPAIPNGDCVAPGGSSGGGSGGSGGSPGGGSGGSGGSSGGSPGGGTPVQLAAGQSAGVLPAGSVQNGAGGLPGTSGAAGVKAARATAKARLCSPRRRPVTAVPERVVTVHGGHLLLRGTARAFRCGASAARVERVSVTILLRKPRGSSHCRFVGGNGRLGTVQSCTKPTSSRLARGTGHWSLRTGLHLAPGRYTVIVRAVDDHGLAEAGGRGADVFQLRVL